jgi:hypothetical protein
MNCFLWLTSTALAQELSFVKYFLDWSAGFLNKWLTPAYVPIAGPSSDATEHIFSKYAYSTFE